MMDPVNPTPTERLAYFKLIGAVIEIASPADQARLFSLPLGYSDAIPVCVGCLSVLSLHTSSHPDFIDSALLVALADILPDVPSMPYEPEELAASPQLVWLTGCASYLCLLSTLDKDNRSGVSSEEFGHRVRCWVQEQRQRVGTRLDGEFEDPRGQLEVIRWKEALQKVDGVFSEQALQ